MSNISIKSNVKEILKLTDDACEQALELVGQVAEGNAIVKAPRDTGYLRANITHKVNAQDKEVFIGTNVEYAPYVEYGTGIYAEKGGRQTPWYYVDDEGKGHFTHGQKPTHFLRNSITENLEEYRQIIASCLGNIGK